MAKQSDKSYRKPYIGMKVKCGSRNNFIGEETIKRITYTTITVEDSQGNEWVTSLDAYTEWLNTGWREPVVDFNDYLKAIEG